MSQLQTLQDIYSKIADLQDLACSGGTTPTSEGIVTQLLAATNINPADWSQFTQVTIENLTNNSTITQAQTEINEVLTLVSTIAQENLRPEDYEIRPQTGAIVPVPRNSPIMLLPKIISAIIRYKAPISIIVEIISDIALDLLKEHIRRKLERPDPNVSGINYIQSAKILKIPPRATHAIAHLDNMPAWSSRRFEEENIDKTAIGLIQTNLALYSEFSAATVAYGYEMADTIYWTHEQLIDRDRMVLEIPPLKYETNRYIFARSDYPNTLGIGYIQPAI